MTPAIFVSVPIGNDGPVLHTETVRYDLFVRRLLKGQVEILEALHIALGLTGEAAELADAIKKEYIYNRPRDIKHIIEELGDVEFYLQAAYYHYGVERSSVIQKNAEKLATRYAGLTYSDEAAQGRADKKEGGHG